MYPARNNELLNFVCIHPDPQETADGDNTWNREGRVEDLLKCYEGFDPRALKLLALADPESLKVMPHIHSFPTRDKELRKPLKTPPLWDVFYLWERQGQMYQVACN
ncbi:hypothetical protein LTR74_018374, partial [Friedmanniomyces endolithicus]